MSDRCSNGCCEFGGRAYDSWGKECNAVGWHQDGAWSLGDERNFCPATGERLNPDGTTTKGRWDDEV